MEDNPLSSFISYLSSRGLSENSIKAFSSDVKEYLAFNGQPTEQFDALKKKGLTNKTLARKRSSLSIYFKYLGVDVEFPRIKPEMKLPTVLLEVEAKALLFKDKTYKILPKSLFYFLSLSSLFYLHKNSI